MSDPSAASGGRSGLPVRLRTATGELQRVGEDLWEIPADARPDMRVPARVFADAS